MEPAQLLLIVAIFGYVIVKRLAGQPLTAGRLVVLPAIMIGYGLTGLRSVHPTGAVVGLLAVEALLGLGFGVVRGLTMQVYERGGHLWYRYRPLTIAVWVLTIAVRVGVVVVAHQAGVNLPGTTLIAAFGVSLLGEAAVIATRARRTGVPWAPDRRTARAAAGLDR